MSKLKILIARSIFCPNDEHYDISMNGLLTLFDFLISIKNDNVEYSLFVVGWIKKSYVSYLLNILEINKEIFKDMEYNLWSINYGKYRILNKIKEFSEPYDSVFYSDHDIKIHLDHYNDTDFFIKLQRSLYYEINNKKIGLIALNHLEDIRHQYDVYQNCITLNNDEYIYPDDGNLSSIACGCFFISGTEFFKIKEFKMHSVYGLDDFYLIKYLYKNGFLSVIIKNTYVIHPYGKNKEYNLWKINKIKNMIENRNKNKTNSDYYIDIQDSNNFWNNINSS